LSSAALDTATSAVAGIFNLLQPTASESAAADSKARLPRVFIFIMDLL
jgi:hypothetical protein